jgi:hypothetical protein
MTTDPQRKRCWLLTCAECPKFAREFESAGLAENGAIEHLEEWTQEAGDVNWAHTMTIAEVTRVGRNLA